MGNPRDTGEQQTRPDGVDWDTYSAPDDGRPHYPDNSGSRPVPDHGAQPRRPRRLTWSEWRRDPLNRYRPRDDEFETWETQLNAGEIAQREFQIVRLLAKTARDHARRLEWRTDDAAADFIKSEALPAAVWVANSLPPDALNRVMARFLDILWEEIDRRQKTRSITRL